MRKIHVYNVPDPQEEYTDEKMKEFLIEEHNYRGLFDIQAVLLRYPDLTMNLVFRVDARDD